MITQSWPPVGEVRVPTRHHTSLAGSQSTAPISQTTGGLRLSSRSTLVDTSLYFPPAPASVHPIYTRRHSRDSEDAVPLGAVMSHTHQRARRGGFYKRSLAKVPRRVLLSWRRLRSSREPPFPSPRCLGLSHLPTLVAAEEKKGNKLISGYPIQIQTTKVTVRS